MNTRYAWIFTGCLAAAACAEPGATRGVTSNGYEDCIVLENRDTRVTLCPAVGGRVMEYSFKGKQALPLKNPRDGKPMVSGRFDIGPELTIPGRKILWSGIWTGDITAPRTARLTSPVDPKVGVKLTRDFKLAKEGTELKCTQTIHNVSEHAVAYNHWSRTFAMGEGIVLIPLKGASRFPSRYAMYEDSAVINVRPEDKDIRIREGFLEILAAPRKPKLGMDSTAGWMAYLMPNDLLFVKHFPVYPDRVYGEAASLTLSVWYPSDWSVVELEPIGPLEHIKPGASASFTETWRLAEWKFPAKGESVDLEKLGKRFGEP